MSKYPIKELTNEKFKAGLIRSLERGNLQSATFSINGKEEKIFLTPNLAFKSLSAFDANMKKLRLSDVMQNQKLEHSNKPDNKQEVSQKQGLKKENKIKSDKDAPAQKKTKRQKIA